MNDYKEVYVKVYEELIGEYEEKNPHGSYRDAQKYAEQYIDKRYQDRLGDMADRLKEEYGE